MKIKTSELTGVALDWAIAKAEGAHAFMFDGITCSFSLNGQLRVLSHGWAPAMSYTPSTNWSLAGPIIERERIHLIPRRDVGVTESGREYSEPSDWIAYIRGSRPYWMSVPSYHGSTPLIAAMRCFVASKLGDEVEVPDGLL